jgi:two-component system NarL family sensor kinase
VILIYGIIFISLLLIGLMLFFHFSRKKIVQEQVATIELQLSYQKNILQATIATQEEERNRIAQDLHDEISSKLNIVSLTTNLLLEDETLTISQKDAVEHILSVTSKTLENARKLAHDLLPPVLDKFGLKVALEEFFDDFIRTNKLQILHKVEDVFFFSKTESLHLFRITQELFNNAIRHGKATQIQIDVTTNESVFSLVFKDNGVGFIPEVLSEKAGIGLQNIASRVAILHADLSIESVLGKGSTFTIISNNDE